VVHVSYARGRQIHGRGRSYNASYERFAAANTTGEIFSYGERVYNRIDCMWCTYVRGRQIHGRGRSYNASCERFAAARTTGRYFHTGREFIIG